MTKRVVLIGHPVAHSLSGAMQQAAFDDQGIDATYELREIATNRTVMRAITFARVSYDIPGQEQRFARIRGLRDAESRAAKQIADNISQRVSSFFVAGT